MVLNSSWRGGRGVVSATIFLACTAPVSARRAQAGTAPAAPSALAGSAAPISDAEFEAALPPLDQTAPPMAPTPAASPLNAAPATIAHPAGPVATGGELAQPLPPLAGFDTTPPLTIATAKEDEPSKVRYTVDVVGLKAIGLEARFRQLSALVDGGKKAANAAQVAARAANDVALAEKLLHSEGYLDGTASQTVLPNKSGAAGLVATITAAPGPRYALGAVAITQAPAEPNALAVSALDLHHGQPIIAQAIEDGEAHVSLRLPEQGYPFVKVGQRDILLDPATHVGDYTLPVAAGPKSRFGQLRAAGDPVFGVDHLDVFPRFKPGDLYDNRQVDDLRQALIGTSLFSTIAIEPVDTGHTNPDGTEVVDLLVHQTQGPWHNLSGTAGYETGAGIKATATWTSRNMWSPEGALILTGIGGTQEQGASATFRRSNAGERDRTASLAASIDRQDFDAYKAETFDLAGTIARVSTPIWQKRWTYSYGFELIGTRENGYTGDPSDQRNGTYLIAALPGQIGWDTSNSLLDPTKGFRLTLRLSPEVQEDLSNGGSFDNYARLLAEGSTYYGVTDSLVLAARARLGSIVGASSADIAPSRRYYAGGGGSVRGFGYQELGPKDNANNPIGGRGLTEFAVEARYRFGNYGIVPFVDAGQLTEKSTPTVSNLRYGVGLGARYYTNFGPFRIDVATPLARKAGESKIAVYIGIGQAF